MPLNLSINDLNSAEHSQEPESLEPENLNGLDLIVKSNQNITKPNVVKKIVGPYKGIVIKGVGDVTTYTKQENSSKDGGLFDLSFLGVSKLVKHRIYIPLLHSHIDQKLLGDDLGNVPASVAALIPEFLAETSEIKEVAAGTPVWCNFLDRENFKDPIYLGPVDDTKGVPSDSSKIGSSVANNGTVSSGLAGIAGRGDPFGGVSYKNSSGQVSYPAVANNWNGELPRNGFTATTATVEELLKIARAQIGKKEDPEGSNSGDEINQFNGDRKEPWSAAGIAWCFREIGAPLPADKIPFPGTGGSNPAHSISAEYGAELWAKALGAWFQEPQAGDIVVYSTSNSNNISSANRHVGIVNRVNGDIIETIEFNWGSKVTETKQNWKTSEIIYQDGSTQQKYKILGFARRPLPYSGVPGGVLQREPVQNFASGEPPSPPGMYEIVTNGVSEGMADMVYIEGTTILYPTKYLRALEAMRQAYKNETGKTLGIISGYRDVGKQRILYSQYLARGKSPPQVAPPGFSLHNNGRAVDLSTGQPHNGNYERDSVPKPARETAEGWVKEGRYGTVAKWLVENSRRFGYVWAGYSFRELWHYELDVALARSLGLINE
jgi:hypothetical protein